MFRKFLKAESGYSLVEVVAAMVILSIAIIPMVGVFDTGLKSATVSSHYDKARTLANLKMEQAKSLPFATVRDSFPVSSSTPDANGYYQSNWTSVSSTDPSVAVAFPSYFEYRVDKQYMRQPNSSSTTFTNCDPASPDPNIACSPGTKLIRLTITVRWGNNTTYTTYGLASG